jgi:hypothetical protein
MDLLCNFKISETKFAIKEINQVSQDSYLMVESYRNNLELFNLQCWALAYQAFFIILIGCIYLKRIIIMENINLYILNN